MCDVTGLSSKQFTSFDVAAVVRELKTQVLNSVVSNIYQLDAKTLTLKLHKAGKPTFSLILEAGRRMNLTAYASEKPSRPPAFCMALRKYLRNARLSRIEQYEFERVVVLSFDAQDVVFQLILELFGDGNMILVGENGQILQALVYKRMRDRNVVRGEPFKFAPSSGKNPFKVDEEEFNLSLRSSGDVEVVRALARFLSIGGVYAEEVLARAGVQKTNPCNLSSDDEVKTVFEGLQGLLSQVTRGALEPCVVLDENGVLVDAAPLRLKRYESETFTNQPHDTFNEALDEFYAKLSALERVAQRTKIDEFRNEAARLERIIAEQQKVVASAHAEAERYKRVGDAIYAHFSELQAILEKFLGDKKRGKAWTNIVSEALSEKQKGAEPWVFFESFNNEEFSVKVRVDDLPFDLDLQKTLFESASEYYQRSKRAKQKMEGAQAALDDSMSRLEDAKARIDEAQAIELVRPAEALGELEKRRVKRKEWFEKFRWFVSSDGFLVVAGKDAVTNEVLIKKYTVTEDVVFHADIVGAPFVVVKTEQQKPGEECLREAGEFAAAFSRGWREGFASVDVFWVKPEQLSKGGPSGESVGRGAFAVRGERNWMRGVPLRTAVGVAFDEATGMARILGGPVEAVEARVTAHVVVVPGDLKGKELFRRVLRSLAEKVSKELREAILSLSVESVREFIPFGKGTVLKD
jgi:predicted ribosome quality control (RQC) complex YloA/Tae2 family protein